MLCVFSFLAQQIPTTDGKLALTLLELLSSVLCCYCYYLEVVFLASSVAAQVKSVKTTTDRECFISIT